MPRDAVTAADWAHRWEQVMTSYVHDRDAWIRRVIDTTSALTPTPPRVVIDLACGTGALCRAGAHAWPKAQITGVDADAVALHLAGLTGPETARYVVADITTPGWSAALPIPPGGVDALISGWAWHEITPDGVPVLAREAARLLRPGGTLVVADFFPIPARSRRLAAHIEARRERRWKRVEQVPTLETSTGWWEALRAAARDDPQLRAAFTARDARHTTRDAQTEDHATYVDTATWRDALIAAGFSECETLTRDDDTALMAAVAS